MKVGTKPQKAPEFEPVYIKLETEAELDGVYWALYHGHANVFGAANATAAWNAVLKLADYIPHPGLKVLTDGRYGRKSV